MIPIQHKLIDPENHDDIDQLVLEASAIFNLIEIIASYAIRERALNLDSGMADRRFASVIDSTRLFASRAVSPKTQPLRVEEAL
jgi:hypothetical protein